MRRVDVCSAAIDIFGDFGVCARLLREELVVGKSKNLEWLARELCRKGGDALIVRFGRASQRCDVNDHGYIPRKLCQVYRSAVDGDEIVELEQSVVVTCLRRGRPTGH